MRSKIVAFVDNTHNSPLDKRYHELALYKTILKINQKFLLDAIDKLERKIRIDELKGKIDISTISFKDELKVYEKNVAELIDKIEININIIQVCEVPIIKAGIEITGMNSLVVGLTASAQNVCVNIKVSNSDDLVERFKKIEVEGQQMSQRILSERIGALVLAIKNKELLQGDVDDRIKGLKAREDALNSLLELTLNAINSDKTVTDNLLKNQLIKQFRNNYEHIITEINNERELLRAYSASGAANSIETIKDMRNSVNLQLDIIDDRIALNAKFKSYGTNLEYYNSQENNLISRKQMFELFQSILNRGSLVLKPEEKKMLSKLTGDDFNENFFENFNDNFTKLVEGAIDGEDIINQQINAARDCFGAEQLNKLQQLISTLHVKSQETDQMLIKIQQSRDEIQKQMLKELKRVEDSNVSDSEKVALTRSIRKLYEPIIEKLNDAINDLMSLASNYKNSERDAVQLFNLTLNQLTKMIERTELYLSENELTDLINSIKNILNRDSYVEAKSIRNDNAKLKDNLVILEKILSERMQKVQKIAVELREAA